MTPPYSWYLRTDMCQTGNRPSAAPLLTQLRLSVVMRIIFPKIDIMFCQTTCSRKEVGNMWVPCHPAAISCTYIVMPISQVISTGWRHQLKHFSRYWPFVREIHRWPVNSPHKGQWRGALMFFFICAWMHGWVNNRQAGDLRRPWANFDVTVMTSRYQDSSLYNMPH